MGRNEETAGQSAVGDDWSALTAKQSEVLDLLIEHKTSKEISRILGISPHTVDQRIDTARGRLGYASRGELANAYRQRADPMQSIPERLTHEFSGIPAEAEPAQTFARHTATSPTGDAIPRGIDDPGQVIDYRVVPELFDGRWGTLARLAAIFLITLLILMAVLAGFSTYVAVSQAMMR